MEWSQSIVSPKGGELLRTAIAELESPALWNVLGLGAFLFLILAVGAKDLACTCTSLRLIEKWIAVLALKITKVTFEIGAIGLGVLAGSYLWYSTRITFLWWQHLVLGIFWSYAVFVTLIVGIGMQIIQENGSLSDKPDNAPFVILSEAKNLVISMSYKFEILRLKPQNDIVGQAHGRTQFLEWYFSLPRITRFSICVAAFFIVCVTGWIGIFQC